MYSGKFAGQKLPLGMSFFFDDCVAVDAGSDRTCKRHFQVKRIGLFLEHKAPTHKTSHFKSAPVSWLIIRY